MKDFIKVKMVGGYDALVNISDVMAVTKANTGTTKTKIFLRHLDTRLAIDCTEGLRTIAHRIEEAQREGK